MAEAGKLATDKTNGEKLMCSVINFFGIQYYDNGFLPT